MVRSKIQSPSREIERKKKRMNARRGGEEMVRKLEERWSDGAEVGVGESCQSAKSTGT